MNARQVAGRIGILPLRLIAYVLHATGAEKIYKPRFLRHAALFDLSPDVINRLPRHSKSITGAKQDPINLILIGDEDDIKLAFRQSGWLGAHPSNPVLLLIAGLSGATKRKYAQGPFTPHYVNIGLQDLSFQKLTKKQNFSQRHHIRIWKSGIVLPDDQRLWIAAASYDIHLKIQMTPPFIHHEIDPNIDAERDMIAKDLVKVGATRIKSVRMQESIFASAMIENASGGKYFTDGRAVVVEV